MGLRIELDGGKVGPPPYPIVLILTCDSPGGNFPPSRAEFRHSNGFIGARAAATAAGWLERQTPQGRAFLCPDCVRKTGKRAGAPID